MRSVMTIYGTRPEAIKMAPLISAVRAHPALSPIVAVTGQHREMLDQVNELFEIVPDFDMDLMSPGATLTQITTRALAATSELLGRVLPDVVVVQETPPAPSRPHWLPSTTTSRSSTSRRVCGPATSTRRSRRRSTAV